MTEPPVPPTPPPSTPPPPAAPPGTVSPNRNLMIVLSYLGLLALVPLLVEKDDTEVQWHARHGLVLLGFWIVVSVVLAVVSNIIGIDLSGGGCLGCLIPGPGSLVWLAAVVVHILCIYKGINGQRFIIPGISQLAGKF